MRMQRLNATVSCEDVGSVCAACCAVIRSPQAATIRCRISERLMPNIRLMLWGVLAAVLFLNYQTWMHDYEPPAVSAAQTSTSTSTGTGAPSTTAAPANTLADSLPQAASAAPTPTPPAASAAPPAAVPAAQG